MWKDASRCWICLLVVLSGCGFTTTQTVKTNRGAPGAVLVVGQIRSLQAYTHIDFKAFKSAVGGHISENLLRDVNEKTAQKLEKLERDDLNRPEGKTLIVKGEVIHLDSAVMRRYIVVKVELADSSTGETLGVANITGQVEGAVRGLGDAATGVAEGVEKLLRDHMIPKPAG